MSINIYGIFCKTTWKVYYGSTTMTVAKRLIQHKISYGIFLKNSKARYCSSYEILKNNNYEIKLLEICDVENRYERESFYIRTFPCVNKVIPGRTKKDYMELYYKNNKETRNNYYKIWRENNKEKLKEYNKTYLENNKEELSEKRKEWREKNKEKIAEKLKEKYTCECESNLRKSDKVRHEKSIKHQNYIKNLNKVL